MDASEEEARDGPRRPATVAPSPAGGAGGSVEERIAAPREDGDRAHDDSTEAPSAALNREEARTRGLLPL